jgi:hypothetical protein
MFAIAGCLKRKRTCTGGSRIESHEMLLQKPRNLRTAVLFAPISAHFLRGKCPVADAIHARGSVLMRYGHQPAAADCIAAAPILEILPAIPSRQFINVVPRLAFIAIGDFAKVAPHKKANDQEGGAASRTQRRWRRTRQ